MSEPLTITLKTLTPLWTGGADQTSDRLHETGLIGSLRWWYEALVRGLGGYACDPTDEKTKCKEYDPKKGKQGICAACYLFGTTGWARLFRLRIIDESLKVPLHFYTTLPANKRWLGSIFGGERRNNRVDGITVPYGKLRLEIVRRGQDEEYALNQLVWAVEFAAQYGGLGAKLQHGFGQVVLETSLRERATKGEQAIKQRYTEFYKPAVKSDQWPNRQRFVSYAYRIPKGHSLFEFISKPENLIGTATADAAYLPCVLDFRYKGEVDGKQFGFRQWLLSKSWSKTQINSLLGETQAQRDEERSASRLCFGMPWLDDQNKYSLKVFGFVPPSVPVKQVSDEIKAYISYLFGSPKTGGD